MKTPSPRDFGLPEKFDAFRSVQLQGLDVMITSHKRIVACGMPTGTGKSLTYMAAAIKSGVATCIVTNSRGLQDQLMDDFSEVGLVDIRGKRNYQCDMRDDYSCEEGHAARCPYKGTVACSLSQAEMRAATSKLVVTNYDKWTSARKYGQGMQHFQQVIFDEGHVMYDALAKTMQVELNSKEVEDTLKIDFPNSSSAIDFSGWKSWASAARIIAEDEMLKAKARFTGVTSPKSAWVKHYTHMRNLVKRLATLSTANAQEWLADETEKGYIFDPIRPGRYSEAALLFKVPKVIIVSATLRPKSLYMIGIAKDQFEFKEFDSDFDPKRCPIYYSPTMPVDSKHPDQRLLWIKLDQVAKARSDRNGLVQTVSYARRDEILQHSRNSEKMLFNAKGEPPAYMIDKFKRMYPGAILVSPSIGTGYDFAFKAAEWSFLCKIPFDPPSKIAKARQQDDKEYGTYRAMQKMEQTFGRVMRDKKDQGENIICDDNMKWFIPACGHLATRNFHRMYRKVDVIPPPPPRLP